MILNGVSIWARFVSRCRIIIFGDNEGSIHSTISSASTNLCGSHLIRAVQKICNNQSSNLWFEKANTNSNPVDASSRGELVPAWGARISADCLYLIETGSRVHDGGKCATDLGYCRAMSVCISCVWKWARCVWVPQMRAHLRMNSPTHLATAIQKNDRRVSAAVMWCAD